MEPENKFSVPKQKSTDLNLLILRMEPRFQSQVPK